MSELNPISGKTLDFTGENIDKLKGLFPEILTDGQIDFEKLRLILGDEVNDKPEKYSFTWNGKSNAIKLAQQPSTGTLKPNKENSKSWDATENLYIEGDNLEVLKLLQKSYSEKIKMIYIDPPYNTGNDFVYNDDFKDNIQNYFEQTGQVDHTGNKLATNSESNGRFHTDWLNMMYPRLYLARNLMSDDGVIFISIGEKEYANLKKMCDEIFGEHNFITTFIWEKTQHFGRQKKNYYSNADYILAYGKNLKSNGDLKELLVEKVKTEHEDAPLYNASNPVNNLVFPKGTVKFNIDDGIYKKSTDSKFELQETVEVLNGYNNTDLKIKFSSRWSQERILKEIDKGSVYWVKSDIFSVRVIYGDEKTSLESPKQILFTNSNNPMCSYSRYGKKVGTSDEATSEVNKLLDNKLFSYPKPTSLIEYLISLIWSEDESYENDFTILDFFAGSGTTAQSVMNLNAMDAGERKFIVVQLPEPIDKNINISSLSQERIRLAGDKIAQDNQLNKEEFDNGFKVFELDTSNIQKWNADSENIEESLFAMENNFIEGRSNVDIVYEVLLKLGLDLNTHFEEKNVDESTVYDIAFGNVYIVLGDNITHEVANYIAEKQKEYENENPSAVFNDNGFKNDNEKLNAIEILKNNGFNEEQLMSI